MITLNVAVDCFTAAVNLANCPVPRNVRLGSLIVWTQPGLGGSARGGYTAANVLRADCGAVGPRSGLPLRSSHWWLALAFAERNERSSRKNTSRFLPHRNDR